MTSIAVYPYHLRDLEPTWRKTALFARYRAAIDWFDCLVTSILSHLWRCEPKSAVPRYTPS